MSKLKSEKDYEKTFAFKFKRWLSGTKDPYLDEVEMKVQHHTKDTEESITERMRDRLMYLEKTYDAKNNKLLRNFSLTYRIISVVFCILVALLLLYTVSWLPATGEADKAVNNEVEERYIESGLQETGAVNIVSGMILTYRAFDTFGETNVLFIATCCVMIMLMLEEKELEWQEEENNHRRFEPKNDVILMMAAKVLCPIIFVFGIYVILNGHLSPGGGFSGGAIIGAGMILYVSAYGFKKTQKWFNENIYKICKISALCTYGLIGTYFYINGANGGAYTPFGIPGNIISSGIVLPINIAVGLEVACTMYAFYALFRRGGL